MMDHQTNELTSEGMLLSPNMTASELEQLVAMTTADLDNLVTNNDNSSNVNTPGCVMWQDPGATYAEQGSGARIVAITSTDMLSAPATSCDSQVEKLPAFGSITSNKRSLLNPLKIRIITQSQSVMDYAQTASTEPQFALDDAQTSINEPQSTVIEAQTAITQSQSAIDDAQTTMTEPQSANDATLPTTTKPPSAIDDAQTAMNAQYMVTPPSAASDVLNDNVPPAAQQTMTSSESLQYVPANPAQRLRKHVCEVCGFQAKKYDLAIHMNKHTKASLHKCEQCDKSYRYRRNLLEHVHNEHSGRERTQYMCEICGNSYKAKGALVKHKQRKHLGKPTFPCRYCELVFERAPQLRQHLQVTHMDEQVAAGELIPAAQVTAQRVMHEYRSRNEDGTIVFTCPICAKSFKAGFILRSHLRMHNNERPFACSQCDRSFKQHSHLLSHELIHQDPANRPHKCEVCCKAFRDRTKLRHHLRTHWQDNEATSEKTAIRHRPKTLRCLECGQLFSQPAAFKRHLKQHQLQQFSQAEPTPGDSGNPAQDANVQIVNVDLDITTNVRITKQTDD